MATLILFFIIYEFKRVLILYNQNTLLSDNANNMVEKLFCTSFSLTFQTQYKKTQPNLKFSCVLFIHICFIFLKNLTCI
jgi:hypothetical protein